MVATANGRIILFYSLVNVNALYSIIGCISTHGFAFAGGGPLTPSRGVVSQLPDGASAPAARAALSDHSREMLRRAAVGSGWQVTG
jgi:hypothetical protein